LLSSLHGGGERVLVEAAADQVLHFLGKCRHFGDVADHRGGL
jgi:hypothetical protein